MGETKYYSECAMSDPVRIGEATLYQGDVLDCLAAIPSDSVHCVVTSPPYWGLRDYGVEGMIGLEPTFQEWLDKMVTVCREVRRVLRPDGTFWLNCGDCYAHDGACGGGSPFKDIDERRMTDRSAQLKTGDTCSKGTFKPKDLLLMPARLAIALQADGWWLRSEIIWAKPNPMPESVTDRPTSAHEKIYLLTKAARYFYDADAVREKCIYDGLMPEKREYNGKGQYGGDPAFKITPEAGRNLRNVWTMATQPYPEAHFATFPEELPRKCIMAGTSERGVCGKCGAQWVRVVERSGVKPGDSLNAPMSGINQDNFGGKGDVRMGGGTKRQEWLNEHPIITTGFQPSCTCNADTVPATVLDPFAGAGTTMLVALQLDRRAMGIELNPEYCELIIKRIEGEARQGKLFGREGEG